MSEAHVFALGLALVVPPFARAADLVVTRYDDPAPDGCAPDDCSLREAVVAANAAGAGDRVFLSAGTYLLSIPGTDENDGLTGDLNVRQDLEILGAGAPVTTIDGGLLDNVIEILGSGTDVTIRGVTIRGADGVGLAKGGSGNLLVEDCEIRDNGNSSGDHGVLVLLGASALLRRTTVAGNAGAGVVTNHTIILFEYAVEGQRRGQPLEAALIEAGRKRLRPIFLTVILSIGGLLPQAVHGGTLWPPMAWALIFGLLLSLVLTIVVTPSFYKLVRRRTE